jgi:hypothetical protein
MSCNILPGDVGNEFLESVAFPIQDQRHLGLLGCHAKSCRTDKKAKLERHIEPGKLVFRVELRARDVMHTEPARLDHLDDFLDPDLAAIIDFQSAVCAGSRNNRSRKSAGEISADILCQRGS